MNDVWEWWAVELSLTSTGYVTIDVVINRKRVKVWGCELRICNASLQSWAIRNCILVIWRNDIMEVWIEHASEGFASLF